MERKTPENDDQEEKNAEQQVPQDIEEIKDNAEEEKPEVIEDEHWRLGGRKALKTLMTLLIGPFISQVVSAFYGVIDSMWVAKALGTKGVSAISLYTNLDGIGRAFGFFLNCGVTQKISGLIGENRGDEGGQVISDLFRMCFICGLIVPALIIPCAKPLADWFGSDEETTNMGFGYLCVIMGGSCLSILFLFACGCLQAEGRTMLVGVMQVISFVLNMAVFDPLFLFAFKTDVYGAGIATILAEGIPAAIIMFMFYRGKFSIKPTASQLLKKFSPESYTAMKVGFSQLFANLAQSLPGILIRKYLGLASNRTGGNFTQAMAGFNGVIRIFGLTNAFRLATCNALLPTASYAHHAGRNHRMFYLLLHASWTNILWGLFTFLLSFFASRELSSLISSDKEYLDWAAPMLKAANYDALHAWIRFLCQSMLQALEYGTTATIYSLFATLAANMAISTVLYFTKNDDVVRLMYTYPITSAVAGVVGILLVFVPVYKAFRKGDVAPDNEDKEVESIPEL